MKKPPITIATLNEMTVKELRAVAKKSGIKLRRLCTTKNAIKLAIVHHLEETTTRKLALAKAEAAKSKTPSKSEKIAKVITEPKRKKEATSARMEVIRTLVEVCGEQSGVNDTWIWIFESNEQNWSGDHALILTDREITEFVRLSTGKQSQVFEHVSMLVAMGKRRRPSKKVIVGALCVSALAFLYGVDRGDMFSILCGLMCVYSLVEYWLLPRRSLIGGRAARYSVYAILGLMSYFVDSDWRFNLCWAVVTIVPCVVIERSRMRLRRKLPIEKWPDGLFM